MLAEGRRHLVRHMMAYSFELERNYAEVHVREPSLERTRAILARWTRSLAGDGDEPFTPNAVETALQLAHRFLSRGRLPRKALDPLRQLHRVHGGRRTVTENDVVERFAENYDLPRVLIDPRRSLDLDDLEGFFRSRVLGQPEAVSAVARMVSRTKAGPTARSGSSSRRTTPRRTPASG